MIRGTDLSIFSFGREEQARVTGAKTGSATLEGSAAEPASDHHPKPGMVLDLENLTPETLEAFFPSERAAAK